MSCLPHGASNQLSKRAPAQRGGFFMQVVRALDQLPQNSFTQAMASLLDMPL
jgi:hypothetical protein